MATKAGMPIIAQTRSLTVIACSTLLSPSEINEKDEHDRERDPDDCADQISYCDRVVHRLLREEQRSVFQLPIPLGGVLADVRIVGDPPGQVSYKFMAHHPAMPAFAERDQIRWI